MRSGDTRRAAAALVAAAGLAGCVSGPSPRDHYYRVEVAAPERLPEPLLGGALEVDRPRADALTNERPLLFRESADSPRLEQYAFHQWADSPTLMLQAALVTYLREAGAARQVVTPELRVQPDFRLTGRLLRFERVLGAGGGAVLEVEYALTDASGGDLLLLATYRETRPAGGGVESAAAALDEATAAVFRRLLADLPRRPAP